MLEQNLTHTTEFRAANMQPIIVDMTVKLSFPVKKYSTIALKIIEVHVNTKRLPARKLWQDTRSSSAACQHNSSPRCWNIKCHILQEHRDKLFKTF
jgi:hypothetical protein